MRSRARGTRPIPLLASLWCFNAALALAGSVPQQQGQQQGPSWELTGPSWEIEVDECHDSHAFAQRIRGHTERSEEDCNGLKDAKVRPRPGGQTPRRELLPVRRSSFQRTASVSANYLDQWAILARTPSSLLERWRGGCLDRCCIPHAPCVSGGFQPR